MELHDKTIAITGAAKGIGAATAIRLAGEGCIGEPDEIAKTEQFILKMTISSADAVSTSMARCGYNRTSIRSFT
jgi:NAD(P)-dependent dehydrogenase (short-subunit alcohol dehydrogenase family)